jgi:nucleotidyltransferase substrate binding protein (TIGR01987 family)
MTKIHDEIKKQLEKATSRLEEALKLPKDAVVRDSAIQRFEFCVDLSWKYLKQYLKAEKGVVANTPKDVFREAYTAGMIAYSDVWIELVDMRNETSHSYDEAVADRIYARLPEALGMFQKLLVLPSQA